MSIIEISESNFTEEVEKSEKPVLVDFWAPWCGPCKMISPLVEEIANEYEGKIKVGKINVDDNQQLAAKFGISAIPTLLVFKNGNVDNQIVGMINKEGIIEKLGV